MASSQRYVLNNVIHNNNLGGIRVFGTINTSFNMTALNNIITENGTFGISSEFPAGSSVYEDYNDFRNNTNGESINVVVGVNRQSLAEDPYIDEANDNYNLNDVAGGGALSRDSGLGYGD